MAPPARNQLLQNISILLWREAGGAVESCLRPLPGNAGDGGVADTDAVYGGDCVDGADAVDGAGRADGADGCDGANGADER